jgi:hypothetical protein
MANPLSGSPLGLTSLNSLSVNGMSNFYGGRDNNINVVNYNNGLPEVYRLDGKDVAGTISLFTGKRINRFFPNIGNIGTNKDSSGLNDVYNGINRTELHNNSVYDTSILNIIEKLAPCPKAALKAQDFAYLKHVGVFPNNRLMIARRFSTPVKDNIMDRSGIQPRSVLISWKPEGEDFLEFTFGEEWDEADADFTNILSGFGKDFLFKNLGGALGSGSNVVPLPGFTEVWQRALFENLGILNKGSSSEDVLPSGNPNIIKRAKKRRTIGYSEAGSGLKCRISVKMEVEYEQKFISGIDPTIAWMDIISNAISFGTSNSSTYGLSAEFAKKLDVWTTNPGILINDVIESLKKAFEDVKDKISSLILNSGKLVDDVRQLNTDQLKQTAEQAVNKFGNIISKTIESVVRKYKVQVMGIANALSGSPSTPWHITIGNPLRPIFCSGDMLTEDVTVVLGSTLAFNDLPSTIKVSFTLTNARPLGMQEILAKFNTGHLRITQIKKEFLEKEDLGLNQIQKVQEDNQVQNIQNDQRLQERLSLTTGIAAPSNTSLTNILPGTQNTNLINRSLGNLLGKTTKESDFLGFSGG